MFLSFFFCFSSLLQPILSWFNCKINRKGAKNETKFETNKRYITDVEINAFSFKNASAFLLRGGSHLPADIIIVANNATIINDKSSNPAFWQILTDQESESCLDCLFSRDELATESATKALHPCFSWWFPCYPPIKPLVSGTKKSPSPEL